MPELTPLQRAVKYAWHIDGAAEALEQKNRALEVAAVAFNGEAELYRDETEDGSPNYQPHAKYLHKIADKCRAAMEL